MLQLLVSRNGLRVPLQWKLESRTQSVFRLEDLAHVTAEQKAERAAWLFDKDEKPSPNPATNSTQ
jgi:hypothetical protein